MRPYVTVTARFLVKITRQTSAVRLTSRNRQRRNLTRRDYTGR